MPLLSEPEITIRSSGEYTSSLSIATLSTGHAGNYSCVASNAVASDWHASFLRVNGKYDFVGCNGRRVVYFKSLLWSALNKNSGE